MKRKPTFRWEALTESGSTLVVYAATERAALGLLDERGFGLVIKSITSKGFVDAAGWLHLPDDAEAKLLVDEKPEKSKKD